MAKSSSVGLRDELMNLNEWESQTWVAVIAVLVSAGSLLVNICWNRKQRLREDQMRYLDAAVNALEIAYREICPDKGNVPPRRRLNWLTCARNVLYAREFSPLIKDSAITRLWVARQEYWRVRMYELLDVEELNQKDYFGERISMEELGVDVRSAYVIFRFVQAKSYDDPMLGFKKITLEEMADSLEPIPTRGLYFKLREIARLEQDRKDSDAPSS